MPIVNTTKGIDLQQRVTVAGNFFARLVGLLGTVNPDPQKAFYIDPCMGLHTLGMKYPIDVVFLNSERKVIKLLPNLSPNRITRIMLSAKCAIELPPNTLNDNLFQIGDQLKVITDEHFYAKTDVLRMILHWPANIFIALLWGQLVYSSFLGWQQSGGVSSLGLVLVNTLLFFLFLTRRESTEISPRILDWVIPILTIGLSMTLQSHPSDNGMTIAISGAVQVIGILAILASLLCLGRSFGIVPANRRIKYAGAYEIVRHPLYASEMVFYVGFVLGNTSVFNFSAIILILLGQMYRAVSEEKLLSREREYQDYLRRVKYRFIPGFF
jgi:protein-S-isoprenylcysteine O-methyltransferase Ste14/uncharacterized membrane protein (UPF0127 family)